MQKEIGCLRFIVLLFHILKKHVPTLHRRSHRRLGDDPPLDDRAGIPDPPPFPVLSFHLFFVFLSWILL